MHSKKLDLSNKLFVSLEIVHQLTESLLSKQLECQGINTTQFSVLSHLSRHNTHPHTITMLAQAMQMNQPRMTKVITKLADMRLVSITKDDIDGRKKWIAIAHNGLEKIASANALLTPAIEQIFSDWNEDEIALTLDKISKLKSWLDQNR